MAVEDLNPLQNPMDLPPEFKAWLVKYLEANPPSLPVAQMLGYDPTQFPGAELGYWEQTGIVNVTATAFPGTAIIADHSADYPGGPVIVEFFAPYVSTPSAAAGNLTEFALFVNDVQNVILGYLKTPAAGQLAGPVLLRKRVTIAKGSQALRVDAAASNTTGTPQAGGGTGTVPSGFPPCYLRVTKV